MFFENTDGFCIYAHDRFYWLLALDANFSIAQVQARSHVEHMHAQTHVGKFGVYFSVFFIYIKEKRATSMDDRTIFAPAAYAELLLLLHHGGGLFVRREGGGGVGGEGAF